MKIEKLSIQEEEVMRCVWQLGRCNIKAIVELLPSVKEKDYKRHFVSGFVRDYFKNSFREMVSFFAQEEKISPDELKGIIDEIEKGNS